MLSERDMYGFAEILFEYNPQGRYLAVCALDPISLLEATIIAPSHVPLPQLKRMAARKLRMRVDKAQHKNRKHTTSNTQNTYGKQQDNSGWLV